MEYLSVSQYAKETGKDVGNIRRMLLNGRLDGMKIGNQWVIPKGTIYPSDLRVKSGQYRNWRHKKSLWLRHSELMNVIKEMSIKISDVYGDGLDSVIIYGSYARGEETADSDVDIALVLNKHETEQMHDMMTDIVVEYELDQNKVLSVITLDYKEYSEWKSVLPFFKNLKKDGVVVWKAH